MASPATVDDYLATLPDDRRAAVEELRLTINAAAPEATETIAYEMPALRSHGGQFLVSYAAYKNHYSLFPASGAVVEALAEELTPYLAARGPSASRRAGRSPPRSSRRSSKSGSSRTRNEPAATMLARLEMSESKTASPIGRLGWIQIDCPDPERLAAFWAEVLAVDIDARLGDPPQFVNLGPAEPGAPQVCFQRVPEPKSVKNRVHLDLQVEDVDVACARVETLGGRRRDDHDFHEHGYSWRRMSDPEGNEFCLIYGDDQPAAEP